LFIHSCIGFRRKKQRFSAAVVLWRCVGSARDGARLAWCRGAVLAVLCCAWFFEAVVWVFSVLGFVVRGGGAGGAGVLGGLSRARVCARGRGGGRGAVARRRGAELRESERESVERD
jgi:hypothetical protein